MTIRRAPKAGYDTDAKAAYREEVWKQFRARARTGLKFCRVLIMPSVEGKEIEVAERYGCRRENIVAVDLNAAIAATVSRKYPGITAWGCNVFDAPKRAADDGRPFDLLHLDLTSNLSPEILQRLSEASAYIPAGAVVCLNSMKGRESPKWLDGLSPDDCYRFVMESLRWNPRQKKRTAEAFKQSHADDNRSLQELDADLEERKKIAARDYSFRRNCAVWKSTGWRIVGKHDHASERTYISGRVPMFYSFWRAA